MPPSCKLKGCWSCSAATHVLHLLINIHLRHESCSRGEHLSVAPPAQGATKSASDNAPQAPLRPSPPAAHEITVQKQTYGILS